MPIVVRGKSTVRRGHGPRLACPTVTTDEVTHLGRKVLYRDTALLVYIVILILLLVQILLVVIAPLTSPRRGKRWSFPRKQRLECFKEYLNLAITVETGEDGSEVLHGENDFWCLFWEEDEPPELDD